MLWEEGQGYTHDGFAINTFAISGEKAKKERERITEILPASRASLWLQEGRAFMS